MGKFWKMPSYMFHFFATHKQVVGDITTGRKPAYLGRVNFISSKPALVFNLYYKLGISRDQTGHIYEPVLGLCKPTGVTHVYKGMTRRRFKDDRQQFET